MVSTSQGEFSSTDRMVPGFTFTNEVPPLTSKLTLSVSNEPVFKLLDSFLEEEIFSSSPSNNMPLNISCKQSLVCTSMY